MLDIIIHRAARLSRFLIAAIVVIFIGSVINQSLGVTVNAPNLLSHLTGVFIYYLMGIFCYIAGRRIFN